MLFHDRRDAGRVLAQAIRASHDGRDWVDPVVLGLPRGGVPVAFEVARELSLPLDVLVVRKLGVPGQEELAMGAIASGGTVVINQVVVHELGISLETIEEVAQQERMEVERRECAYRNGQPARVGGRTAILIDDGLATGSSMMAAARSLRSRAREVIVAVPVAAESTCNKLRSEGDQIICATTPQLFFALGMFYRNFAQITDEEVRTLLSNARGWHRTEDATTEHSEAKLAGPPYP
jgi:putative phosphoribosyl transferase